ncbi:MAG: PTS fructose transporter subunit IIA [Gammaproteobacteria bacterium]|nr:MAG: PTS fructose transporter subunit IIA [Gammaproteobacteria bacterium]
MSVGLLLICHEYVGAGLLSAAKSICGAYEGNVDDVAVTHAAQPENFLQSIERQLEPLDSGSGVLVLSDLYGSTPSNIATQFYQPGEVAVVLGVNLPMLIRVFNYSGSDLDELSIKAAYGGRDGVFIYPPQIKEDGYAK